jgi:hypothetical protein
MGRYSRTPQERFWTKVDKTPGHGPNGDCWVWTAATTGKDGYGRFYLDGEYVLAHRVSWEWANRMLGEGDCVCHSCDHPPCVRPSHLWVGALVENSLDASAKGRLFAFRKGAANPRSRFRKPEMKRK